MALAERYSLRLHMLAMLMAMVALGTVATSALRGAGVGSMALRYPMVVLVAYAGFLVFVWLWLRYVGQGSEAHPPLPAAAVAAAAMPAPRRSETGAWDEVAEGAGEVAEAAIEVADGSVSGGSFDIGDGEGAVVVVVVGIVVAVLMGLGAYAVWEAPAILGDALFQVALAAAVQRSVGRAETEHWLASVWRATWWMVALGRVLSVIAGWAVESYCAGATTAIDAFRCEP